MVEIVASKDGFRNKGCGDRASTSNFTYTNAYNTQR